MASSYPPVPAKPREMLKDYPEHIEKLLRALNSVKDRSIQSIPPYEAVVWLLEDHLSGFISEARAEQATAEASGDPEAIAQAQGKERLIVLRQVRRDWYAQARRTQRVLRPSFKRHLTTPSDSQKPQIALNLPLQVQILMKTCQTAE